VLIAATLLAASGFAQVPVGSINGIVTDPKDAIVIGGHVTAVSAAQGVSRDYSHERQWSLRIVRSTPGNYDLRIEQAGFAVSEFKGVVLEAGLSRTIDARLAIAMPGLRWK